MQYSENHDRRAFLTTEIMNLHANSPDRNAARNPTARGNRPTDEPATSPFTTDRNASPSIGMITIRKENFATAMAKVKKY